jgi:hypothetical protein
MRGHCGKVNNDISRHLLAASTKETEEVLLEDPKRNEL